MILGEPDAGKPPVRFDEGRSQTVIGRGASQPVDSAYSTPGRVWDGFCPLRVVGVSGTVRA